MRRTRPGYATSPGAPAVYRLLGCCDIPPLYSREFYWGLYTSELLSWLLQYLLLRPHSAYENVERLTNLDKPILYTDNFSRTDHRLPGLQPSVDVTIPIILGPASPKAQLNPSLLEFNAGYWNLLNVIHPTSVVANTVKVNHGVYVNPLSSVGSNTVINYNNDKIKISLVLVGGCFIGNAIVNRLKSINY